MSVAGICCEIVSLKTMGEELELTEVNVWVLKDRHNTVPQSIIQPGIERTGLIFLSMCLLSTHFNRQRI